MKGRALAAVWPGLRRREVVVHLTPVGQATAAGTALLTFAGSRRLQVRLVMRGLAPGSVHPTHIHFGTCAGGGPIGYPLRDLVAGADGVAESKTVVPGVQAIPPQGWYVNVHEGPTLAGLGATPIACGDVSVAAPVFAPGTRVGHGPAVVDLAPQGGSAANGTATLAFAGRQALLVTLRVRALPACTVHPAHIHFGSCAGGGPIAFPLDDLVAGPDGTAAGTSVLPGILVIPPQGWYVNVHQGPTLEGAGATPVACGDVLPPRPIVPEALR